MWHALGHNTPVLTAGFPEVDPALLVDDTVTAIVQIKGKVKARLEVAKDISEQELRSWLWRMPQSSARLVTPRSAR